MGIPGPLITGTICYAILGGVLMALVLGAMLTGILSKDDAGIANVVIVTATFSTWMFWLCAWMHQWHPLIFPIYEG
eukprot:CAMPEP_0195527454 /NCGR_PEP_ID=MMETSP0794_2-20130614/29143_1 /TAXON_ID=515487 /ORGANISM="Stephanopyxis turris, Strain CCMP 815" /LENGTH=75 /DNA_ID=CAMNT_0040658357 /DNA_START=48 /DNA_END=275 /DNA_ORIENTATION=-